MQTKHKFLALLFLFIFSLFINLILGSVIIPRDIWYNFIFHQQLPDIYEPIFMYRFTKASTAILTGIGLSISGLLMQSMFRNPVAGPYILGTSAAAGLGVAFLILGGTFIGITRINSSLIAFAAITGSLFSLGLILLFYHKLRSAVSLLLTGLMLGIFSGAIINILSYFSQANELQRYVFWTMGNLGNQNMTNIIIMFILVFAGVILSGLLIKRLNALLLGENYAKSMGVPINQTHIQMIILTGVLVGGITAFVGPIAFIGLATPHIARLFFKSQMHQILLPAVILIGSIMMLLCDSIAQVPGSTLSLPINSITALFGAPLVVYLIQKQ